MVRTGYFRDIVKGTFTLRWKNYELTLNNNDIHHKHGGFVSFDKKWWDRVKAETDGDQAVIVLTRTSPDGEENYPGELNVTVTYTNYSTRTRLGNYCHNRQTHDCEHRQSCVLEFRWVGRGN